MTTLDGKEQPLSAYKGKVVIVVNVASKCGYTPQYADLERFYTQNKDKGVVVLGFPANNFMGQEPGTDEEIASFCQKNYGVTFPMFSKISVKGKDIHPLYAYLTEAVGASISWNFNKILIDKNGKPVAHFKSGVKPGDPEFDEAVAKLL
ncbi:MAG: glutathione peroxidase [Bacteroidetes bacterium]|nr:glutathione peroxidase [Bacteroidota bacterium]